ncbi:preprotein translocase subunit YajC [Candidatus Bipolaricaulota bacterium]
MKRLIPVLATWLAVGWQWIARAQEVSGEGTVDSGSSSPLLGDFFPLLLLLVVFGAIFYFMLIRPQRKRQTKMKELLGGLKRGDRVVTAGGIHGEIDTIGENAMVLILEDGAKIRVAKTSVVQKLEK